MIPSMDISDRLIAHTEIMTLIIMYSVITLANMIGSQNTQHMMEEVEDIMSIPSTIDSEAVKVEGTTLRITNSVMLMRISLPVQGLVEGMVAAGGDRHEGRQQVTPPALILAE